MTWDKQKGHAEAGFTLIEMMIAMTILAFISMGIYSLTSSSFTLREKLELENDFYNSIHNALTQMERDFSQIYTPQLKAMPQAMSFAEALQPGLNATNTAGETFNPGERSTFWGQYINRFHVRPTRLQGDDKKITFISNSHVRIYRDSKESDFAKIQYLFDEESIGGSKLNSEKVLARLEDPAIFIDDGRKSETEIRYVLLHKLKSMKFEYLDGKSDQWQNAWDTERLESKNTYPALIKITLEILMPPPAPEGNVFNVTQIYKPELNQ